MFSKPTGVLWAYEAEIKAILTALRFCKEHNMRRIQIESDSSLAVGWVGNNRNRPWKLLNDLHLIDLLMLEMDCVGVHHVFREANSMADFLAKSGCDREIALWEWCG